MKQQIRVAEDYLRDAVEHLTQVAACFQKGKMSAASAELGRCRRAMVEADRFLRSAQRELDDALNA